MRGVRLVAVSLGVVLGGVAAGGCVARLQVRPKDLTKIETLRPGDKASFTTGTFVITSKTSVVATDTRGALAARGPLADAKYDWELDVLVFETPDGPKRLREASSYALTIERPRKTWPMALGVAGGAVGVAALLSLVVFLVVAASAF